MWVNQRPALGLRLSPKRKLVREAGALEERETASPRALERLGPWF